FPDAAVGGMDVLAAAYLHLVQGDGVVGDGLRDTDDAARRVGAGTQVVVRPGEHLTWVVARVSGGAGQELRLLGGIELPELRQGAAEPDPARRCVSKAGRNKAGGAIPGPRLDHEVGDRPSDRVNDHPG